tara:strand:- start:84 stop:554 length:471 start_codon:yes stop_codon:yes gene_type:complete
MSDIDYYQKYLKYKKKYIDLKNDLNGSGRFSKSIKKNFFLNPNKESQQKIQQEFKQKTPQEIQQENIDIIKKHLSYFKKILEIKIKQGTPQKETHQYFIEAISKLNIYLDNFNNLDVDNKNNIIRDLYNILNHVNSINNISQTNIEKTIEAAGNLN